MKKRLLIMLIAALSVVSASMANDKYGRDASVLPAAAQTVLSRNFKAAVSLVKIDKEFGRVSEYEVILSDGTEITFDSKGNWESVEVSRKGSVPAAFVPEAIAAYVKKNEKGQRIVGIEKKRGGYEVELANGLDLKFDSNGKFLRYD